MSRWHAFFSIASTMTAAGFACSVPSSDARDSPAALPDTATFPPVAELLDVRCGSLDCHGATARNLRLYGSAGLRWSPGDQPFVPLCDSTMEIAQDYQSIVGLEPETMGEVVASGGSDPDALTMMRKARGVESHKGGQIWSAGDDSDTCVVSWLAARADEGACERGLATVLPNGSMNPLLSCLADSP